MVEQQTPADWYGAVLRVLLVHTREGPDAEGEAISDSHVLDAIGDWMGT